MDSGVDLVDPDVHLIGFLVGSRPPVQGVAKYRLDLRTSQLLRGSVNRQKLKDDSLRCEIKDAY